MGDWYDMLRCTGILIANAWQHVASKLHAWTRVFPLERREHRSRLQNTV